MDVLDLLKLAADWSLAAVMAGVLIYVIRNSESRQAKLVDRIVGVIGKNTQALADIKPALEEITRFMNAVERRLEAIEVRLRMSNARDGTF